MIGGSIPNLLGMIRIQLGITSDEALFGRLFGDSPEGSFRVAHLGLRTYTKTGLSHTESVGDHTFEI